MPGLNALKTANPDIEIIANPCNNFGLQEPAVNAELLNCYRYVRPGSDYIPDYVVTQKTEVNGNNENPLYTYLKSMCPPTKERIADTDGLYYTPVKITDITWNFEKFLIDQNGNAVKRYEPNFPVASMQDDIDDLVAKYKKAQEAKAAKTPARPLHRFHPRA